MAWCGRRIALLRPRSYAVPAAPALDAFYDPQARRRANQTASVQPPSLCLVEAVAPCRNRGRGFDDEQGAISFLIADAVKIILASRADINEWFPKGSRTVHRTPAY